MRNYSGDFEVHLTVRTANEIALSRFRDWCKERTFKCVHVILARGTHVQQPMATWRRSAVTLPLVLREAKQVEAEMTQAGFSVMRVKVEAGPNNDEVPHEDGDTSAHDPANYFEHHVKLLREATAPREALLQTCEPYGAHLSRNALREVSTNLEERFVTLRCYHRGRISSDQMLRQLLTDFRKLGENVIEVESEYCVHDSNLALDAGWLPG